MKFLMAIPMPETKSGQPCRSRRAFRVNLETLPDLRPDLDLAGGFTTSGEVCQKLAALQVDVAALHAARVLSGVPGPIAETAEALRTLGEVFLECLSARGWDMFLETDRNPEHGLIAVAKNARIHQEAPVD